MEEKRTDTIEEATTENAEITEAEVGEATQLERQQRKEAAEQRRQERKASRGVARQERREERRGIWRIMEFVMLVTFIILAIDQAGLYGFLFVWLFLAFAAVSVVLLLWGIVRGIRRKRCGLTFFLAILGITLCVVWFLFLVSSRGLGLEL